VSTSQLIKLATTLEELLKVADKAIIGPPYLKGEVYLIERKDEYRIVRVETDAHSDGVVEVRFLNARAQRAITKRKWVNDGGVVQVHSGYIREQLELDRNNCLTGSAAAILREAALEPRVSGDG
jgi:hypothetical protein